MAEILTFENVSGTLLVGICDCGGFAANLHRKHGYFL
jgi:hypothetical protein